MRLAKNCKIKVFYQKLRKPVISTKNAYTSTGVELIFTFYFRYWKSWADEDFFSCRFMWAKGAFKRNFVAFVNSQVEEKQYECNCCVMNGPRSFTASTATPPASSAATDLFRHTRLVDQSSSSGTAGINTDYTTEVGTTQIHFWTYFNVSSLMKIQLFSSIFHLNLLKFFWSWGFWKILLGWYDLVLNEFLYFKARGWALEFLRPYFSLLHFRVCFILS